MTPINRRNFLTTAIATGSVALAGCSGKSSSKKWKSTLNSPDTVTYGAEFSHSVVVENTSDSERDFRATLTSQESHLGFSKEISLTVPSGDSKKITTDPITPSAVGEYTFVLNKKDEGTTTAESEGGQNLASTTVTVETKEIAPKTSVKLNDNLLVTAENGRVAKSVFTSSGRDTPTGVLEAPTGKIFAVYNLTVENVGTQRTAWGPAFVSVDGGTLFSDNVPTLPGRGEALNMKHEVSAADSVSGYLFAQLPIESAKNKIPLTAQNGNNSAAPEYRWPFAVDTPRKAPEFTLKNVNAPREVQEGQPYDIELTIANTGDGAGTVKTLLQYKKGGSWTNLQSASPHNIKKKIPAGDEKTITVTNTFSSGFLVSDEYQYRATPFETTWKTSLS